MTTITESDLKELKDLINKRFDELKADNAQLKADNAQLKADNAKILAKINDLETEVKTLNTRVESLETGQKQLETRLTAIETRLNVIENRLEDWKPFIQKIPDWAERMGEQKNLRQLAFIIITATVGGAIGWFIRSGGFKP